MTDALYLLYPEAMIVGSGSVIIGAVMALVISPIFNNPWAAVFGLSLMVVGIGLMFTFIAYRVKHGW